MGDESLLTVEKLLAAGDRQAALNTINQVVFTGLSAGQRSKYNLLEAEIALSGGDAEHAVVMLETARPKLLPIADQLDYYQSLAQAYTQVGRILPAASARIRLIGLSQDQKFRQENMAGILDMLQTLSLETLNSRSSLFDELTSWMGLAKILKLRDQPGYEMNLQLNQWQLKFPGHPLTPAFLQTYLASVPLVQPVEPEIAAAAKVPGIAVLLPQSGSYAAAGKAVADGLQMARQLAANAAPQLPLKFYDSEGGNIADIYQQAVVEGAVQVIGPLVKEQILELADMPELNVPVLALNQVENLKKPHLYQFGLSPIDEAEQLVLKARSEGGQTAVVLTANTRQGRRLAAYLAAAWQNSGGVLADSQGYEPGQHDFSAVLTALLGANTDSGSWQRTDTVLLAASPELGRELAVQLKYHQTGNLAIYAMPGIFSGYPNPVKDAELSSIGFCDIPWLFDGDDGPLSRAALAGKWQAPGEGQIRLRALGVDAFNLLSRLAQLAETPYVGVTGRLSLDGDNRITRKLVCARFKGGVPLVSGYME
ncbi:MAG: penicillin-binding protein activator [Methylococcales bacterium]|nr:penicillin-binding protein activator [Methylococcales bacterium]